MNHFNTNMHFIAYFDILGYKQLVKSMEIFRIAQLIEETIKLARKLIKQLDEDDSPSDIKLRVFSDNFFVCAKYDWYGLVIMTHFIQQYLVRQGIFIRGAMCHGEILFTDEVICGQGLIDVYSLESELAIFPRVIIDDSYIEGAKVMYSNEQKRELTIDDVYKVLQESGAYKIDFDGFKVIDYLNSMLATALHLLAENNEEGHHKASTNFLTTLEIHKQLIISKLRENQGNLRVLQKFLWCKGYHNSFCRSYGANESIID